MAAPRLLNKNNSGETIVSHASMLIMTPVTHHLAVKRIMQEAHELANDPSTEYSAAPLEVRSTPSPLLSLSKIPHVHILTFLHFAFARRLRMTFSCVFPRHDDVFFCSYSIYSGTRSGIAPCAGQRAQILRGDCIISGSGYLQNIHFVHQASWSSPQTAGLN